MMLLTTQDRIDMQQLKQKYKRGTISQGQYHVALLPYFEKNR